MKKLILPILMMFVTAPAFSQIVRSTTFTDNKRATEWFMRVGLSANNLTGPAMSETKDNLKDFKGDAGFSSRANFDLMFGFNKYFGKSNVYWGMELGVATRGGAFHQEYSSEFGKGTLTSTQKWHANTYGVKYVPFTFGYKYPVTKDVKIDAHLGLFIECDFAGSIKSETSLVYPSEYSNRNETYDQNLSFDDEGIDMSRVDAGLQLGLGVWYKRFNLNFTWQRGFAPYIGGPYNKSGDHLFYQSSNAIISLGVAF